MSTAVMCVLPLVVSATVRMLEIKGSRIVNAVHHGSSAKYDTFLNHSGIYTRDPTYPWVD